MKTEKEWSDAFDVLYNQGMSNASAALDEYDKSIFLTKGQEETIKNYFNPKGNKYQEGYDDSAKRQADFATLMKVDTLSAASSYSKFDSRSEAYQFPDDFFLAVNEQFQITVGSGTSAKTYPYTIIPISYTEYALKMQKPYKYPPKSQVWRLITGEATVNSNKVPVVEVIGRYNPDGTKAYKLRYIRRPKPIILVDLTTVDNNLSINGETAATPCELPEHIHEEILQRAVELAKAAYASDQNGQAQLQNQITVGQRSE
jgi:hypothetical protein